MNEETSITDLIRRLRDDSTTLIRDEVALAKTEVSEKISMLGKNLGSILAGAMVGYSALVLLLIAIGSLAAEGLISVGLAPAMAHFVGLASVAIVVGIISAVMVTKAIENLKTASLAPQRTIESLRNDKEFVKQQIK
jgi:hypothetical protein